MNITDEYELWILFMNTMYEYHLWIWFMNITHEYNLWILFINIISILDPRLVEKPSENHFFGRRRSVLTSASGGVGGPGLDSS